MSRKEYPIKANSSIIQLLGEELIGSDILALFELVKNAYDADAENVIVRFNYDYNGERIIVVEDDGCGMSPEVIDNAWLTIGTDYKKSERKRSKELNRPALGSKGVGRLAVHRLAEAITLETKTDSEPRGSRLFLNWTKLVASQKRIQDLTVEVENDVDIPFNKGHGTRILLSSLRSKEWSKADIVDLVRKVYNIMSPFHSFVDFSIIVESNSPVVQSWIDSVMAPDILLNNSLYYYSFRIEQDFLCNQQGYQAGIPAFFSWNYEFRPTNLSLNERRQSGKNEILLVNWKEHDTKSSQKILLNKNLEKIGPIEGQFFAFNLNTRIINATMGAGRKRSTSEFLNENSGVRVFRNNIRVFNYGEPSDDWLGIDMSKMRKVSEHFAKKSIVGFISLRLEESSGLVEKTNREGFIETEEYDALRTIIRSVFDHFERCAFDDRAELEAFLSNSSPVKRPGMDESIRELSERLQQKNLYGEFKPIVTKIEKEYNRMREVMLNSGMAGVNMSLVFHEVERGIRLVNKYLGIENIDVSTVKTKVYQLNRLLEDFSPLLKQNPKIEFSVAELAQKSISLNQSRFNYHHIEVEERLVNDFHHRGASNLLLSSFSNIIDNAIYWMDYKAEIIGDREKYKRKFFVSIDTNSFDGPAIMFADNGNGFEMDQESLVQPYKTLKPDGMGLGLYYVDLVMQSIGGKVLFPDVSAYDVPKDYCGAFVVLVFPKQ